VKPLVRFAESEAEEKPVSATKVCSGHLRKHLAAVRKDGRPYTCGFGKDCTFVHMSIAGKSDQKLLEVAAAMPPPMKQDITRAIHAKK
jgi:Alliinase EGF-like domain